MSTVEELPYRVVDAHNQGWMNCGDGYRADYDHRRGLSILQLDALRRDRGPLRPVLAITEDDEEQLAACFEAAGRKTVTTIAAALEQVCHEVRREAEDRRELDPAGYAWRTLQAGREGSWESVALVKVVLFGNGLNLVASSGPVAERRAAGPRRRVDVDVRAQLVEVFRRWVSDPDRYTEVAETLAAEVSGYADRHGPTGWAVIADQWLQPGGLAAADFRTCYGLLYSRSEHFAAGHL